MQIFTYAAGPVATNVYLVVSKNKACVIDAPEGSFSWIEKKIEEKGIELESLFLTHSHWDHIADLSLFQKKISCKVYVHKEDAFNLESPGKDLLPIPFRIEPTKADFFYKEEEPLKCADLTFKVLFTPGHSFGSICLYEASQKVLFSGDTLFKGGIGNLSFPFSSPEKMKTSLQKIFSLPLDTVVYPGHGPKTTLGEEKKVLGL